MKKLVVLTGAGISAESGLKTFRDAGGLWEGYRIEEVASPDGWRTNQDKVLLFYNQRRHQLKTVVPNKAHKTLAELERAFEVQIITQNVDDLHERAGSNNVLHLHGELLSVRSEKNAALRYRWNDDLNKGQLAEDGAQLRPDIVWFGEEVPLLSNAAEICSTADYLLIIGTSLQVYPAAGLVYEIPPYCPVIYIDPKADSNFTQKKTNTYFIQKTAVEGIDEAVKLLFQI